MANETLLAGLRDIVPAPAPGWWPPAPGWWLLALLVLTALVAYVLPALRRQLARRRHRRAVLAELDRLYAAWGEHHDDRRYSAELSALLKRAALYRFAAREVAALNGADWAAFLDGSGLRGGARDRFADLAGWSLAPYRPDPEAVDIRRLHTLAQRWLRYHF